MNHRKWHGITETPGMVSPKYQSWKQITKQVMGFDVPLLCECMPVAQARKDDHHFVFPGKRFLNNSKK